MPSNSAIKVFEPGPFNSPQTRGPLRAVASNLRTEDIHDLNTLHQRIDQLQIDLGKLHQRIYDQYFALRAAPVMAAVEQPQA